MNSLPGKLLDAELVNLIKEAQGGSKDARTRALTVCWGYLLEMATRELEGRPDYRQEAQMLARGALSEVERHLTRFDGSSEVDLRNWLRQILLEQTRERSDASERYFLRQPEHSTPDRQFVSTSEPGPPESLSTNFDLARLAVGQRAPRTVEDGTLSAVPHGLGQAVPTLEGYEIAGEVARGGMGIVYRAWQQRMQRWVALKCLPPALGGDTQRLERFRQEAQLAGQLTEHGILQVYDVLEADGKPVLVMPYIDGSDLARIIKDRRAVLRGLSGEGKHPWAMLRDRDYLQKIYSLFDTILDALTRLHQADVLHRDLKPSNILVDRNGSCWLTDFGLARLSNSGTTTTGGHGVGTPGYMSPEQWDGEEDIDARTDIFGMGVALYQALTLELPYGKARVSGDSPVALAPRRHQRSLPRSMNPVLLKAIEPDRTKRYATASELQEDWQLVRKGLLPKIAPVSRTQRILHAGTRRPSQVVAIVATVLLAVLLGAMLLQPSNVITRAVSVRTEPSGARIVLVPIDPKNGSLNPKNAIRPKRTTPLTLEKVPVGEYLVVAKLDEHRFHEVYRVVRPTGPGYYPHTSWTEDDEGRVVLPLIKIPSADVSKGMALLEGKEFIVGTVDFGPALAPPYSEQVASFYLDTTEVTVGEYRKIMGDIPPQLRALSPRDDEAVRFVSFDEATYYAEKVGKRLPSEVQLEFAATAGGKHSFPWGDDFSVVKSWPIGRVKIADYDKTDSNPPIYGLFSNVAEWTSSWNAPYPGVIWPDDVLDRVRDHRVFRGGPMAVVWGNPDPCGKDKDDRWKVRWRHSESRDRAHPGLGFRCARSAKALDPATTAAAAR